MSAEQKPKWNNQFDWITGIEGWIINVITFLAKLIGSDPRQFKFEKELGMLTLKAVVDFVSIQSHVDKLPIFCMLSCVPAVYWLKDSPGYIS